MKLRRIVFAYCKDADGRRHHERGHHDLCTDCGGSSFVRLSPARSAGLSAAALGAAGRGLESRRADHGRSKP